MLIKQDLIALKGDLTLVGKWESGNTRAAKVGIANALDILSGNNSSKPI